MRDYINISVLANWVSMLRADIDGAVWLADDDEDARFYGRCIHEAGRIVAAPNCAVRLLDLVHSRGLQGIIATLSRQWSVAELERDNVFCPSVGDVASLLLTSKALDAVLIDVCGNEWIAACRKEIGSILGRVAGIACVLSRLRCLCGTDRTHLFDLDVDPGLVDWAHFELASARISAALASAETLPGLLDQARANCNEDLTQNIVQADGADALKVLAAATSYYRPRGLRALRTVGAADLAALLRVAYDLPEFEADEMFWRMRAWARRNPRYPLLREWRILDPLGIVWDQRYWERDLAQFLRQLTVGQSLAAFKMDLDNFKVVNEVLGHQAGDEAIRLFCKVVKRKLSSSGEVYRRGGDEIVAFAPGLDVGLAERLAEEVRAAIEQEFAEWSRCHGLTKSPTSSIGLAILRQGFTVQESIRLMDEAQRNAKGQGKNRVVVVHHKQQASQPHAHPPVL